MNITPPIHFDVVEGGIKVSINLGKKAAHVATQTLVNGQMADVISSARPVWTPEQIAELSTFAQAKMDELYNLYVVPTLHNPNGLQNAIRIATKKCHQAINEHCKKIGTDSSMLDMENRDAASAVNAMAKAPAAPEESPLDYISVLNQIWDSEPLALFEGSESFYCVSAGHTPLRMRLGVELRDVEGEVNIIDNSLLTDEAAPYEINLSFNAVLPDVVVSLEIASMCAGEGQERSVQIFEHNGALHAMDHNSNPIGTLIADESGFTFKADSSLFFENAGGDFYIRAELIHGNEVVSMCSLEFLNGSAEKEQVEPSESTGSDNTDSDTQ